MKLSNIVQRAHNLYSRGVPTNSSRLSDRYIYIVFKTMRSKIIEQDINKKKTISPWLWQTIPCVELVQAPLSECPCFPKSCTILRTKHKIPKPISHSIGQSIKFISPDSSINISQIAFKDVKYIDGNKYTNKSIRYYIKNDYGYILANKDLGSIPIDGIFDDPLEAAAFPTVCLDSDCKDCDNCFDYLEMDIPIDEDTLQPVFELMKGELIREFKQMTEDTSNNSRDNTETSNIVHR